MDNEHDKLDLPSEEELSFALIERLINQVVKQHFENPEELAGAIRRRVDNYTFIILFVRLKEPDIINGSAIQEAASEMLLQEIQKGHFVVSCRIAGLCPIVLEFRDDILAHPYEEQFKILEEFLEYHRKSVSLRLGIEIQIACSDIIYGLRKSCAEIYRSAQFSLDYVFQIYPDKNVISYHTTMEQIPDTSELAHKPVWEYKYLDALSSYQLKKAEKMLNSLIDQELQHPNTALSIRNRVQNRLLWTLTILNVPVNGRLEECRIIHAVARNVICCKTPQDLHDDVNRFFTLLTRYFQHTPIDIDTKIEMICDYIQQEYSNPAISVNYISDKFSISTGHLSRVFKMKTGVKLIDYVHSTRLDKAKQLLTESQQKLEDIALSVGYSGEWSLIRAFKRYEGMTPGMFRTTEQYKRDISSSKNS